MTLRGLFAILAGLFGGFAIFIKFVAAFFVIGGGVGALLLGRQSLPEVLKQPQIYVMTVLGILPGAAYFIYGVFIAGYLGQQFGGRFIPAYFLNPSYYLGWMNMLNLVIGGIPLMFALLGIFFFVDKGLASFFRCGLGTPSLALPLTITSPPTTTTPCPSSPSPHYPLLRWRICFSNNSPNSPQLTGSRFTALLLTAYWNLHFPLERPHPTELGRLSPPSADVDRDQPNGGRI